MSDYEDGIKYGEAKTQRYFALERREWLAQPAEGGWCHARSYTFDDKAAALAYRDDANALHPGCWRLLFVEVQERAVILTTVETTTTREVLP